MEPLERIAGVVDDTSARGIAKRVAELVADGELQPLDRMPTTRALASRLGVSAGSISDAWKLLVADGVLETQGRRGTFVVDPETATPWRQFRGVVGAHLPVDLSTGFPDPHLLTDIRPFLRRLADGPRFTGYPETELDPRLAEALAPILPFTPTVENTLLATHVLGALAEIFPVIGPPSTRVIVAQPEFAPYLDLLERFRLEPVPVRLDAEGPSLSDVTAAIEAGAKAIILQPRVHNPSGVVTSRPRLNAIAERCAAADVWIFEGDFYGELLPAPRMSAAEWAPDHTLHMKAFSKDVHPDIRVAVMIGAPRLIREAHRRRIGGFDVSRINQDLLRLMLTDPERGDRLATIRTEYSRRQREFLAVLAAHGISVPSGGGFNVWIPVRSEADALVYLASKGIGVAPGSAFQVAADTPHIRVSTAMITRDVEAIAREVARAATVGRAKR